MPFLHHLRQARFLARAMLVWFALSLGVAVASPIVNPQAVELVCSGNGVMKVIIKSDDGVKEVSALGVSNGVSHVLDCPMCATLGAPPPVVKLDAEPNQALSYALQTIPAARIAALVGAPLPARGPPQIS